MKKNYFKKVVSVFAATTVLAMATSAMSAYAADDSLLLVIPEKQATLGVDKTVDVTLSIGGDNKDLKVDSIGLMVSYDENLELVEFKSDVFPTDHILSNKENKKIIFSKGGATQYGTGTELITLTFNVPDKAGKYDISWVEFANKNFFNTTVDADAMVANTPKDGFIEVVAPAPVTTTAPIVTTTAPVVTTTTPVVTTTTPVVTTEAPVTTVVTTEAPVTTAPVVTTTVVTTKTTKTTKDTAKSSPATGTRSNGVAALAATMVVAASAAVVLKKKKD